MLHNPILFYIKVNKSIVLLYCRHIICLTSIQDPRHRVSHSFLKQNKSFTDSSITCCLLGWYNLSKQITHFGISTQNCKVLVRNIMNFISDTAFTVSTLFGLNLFFTSRTLCTPFIHSHLLPIFPIRESMVFLSFFSISTFFLFFFCVSPSLSEITAQLKWKYFLSL